MSITRLRGHLDMAHLRHPFGVMDTFTRQMAKANGTALPAEGIHPTFSVQAYVNHSRWVADCLFCPGAEIVDPSDPRFYCHSCMNEKIQHRWLRVVFPLNVAGIEAELNKRPDPLTRNWMHHETVQDLVQENNERGIE